MNTELLIYGASSVPLIVGLVEVAKETGLPGKFAPLCSLLLGIAFGVLAQYAPAASQIPAEGVVAGITAGLTASGLYSSVSAYISSSSLPSAPTTPPTAPPA